MQLGNLIAEHGYLAVFIGCFLEGESVLLLAGFAAHRGLLRLPDIMLLAFVASTLGDQFFYWVGRRHGAQLFARHPSLARRVPQVQTLLARYHTPLILGIRFLYGLRVAGPVVMGALHVPALRFALLNMAGAALWAVAVGWAGFQFGNLLELLLPEIRRVEEAALLAVAAAVVAWWLLRWLRARNDADVGGRR